MLNGRSFDDLEHAQSAFDRWRRVYNHERPHEALQMQTPISRYQPSFRAFPDVLPPVEYGLDDQILRVKWNGELRFRELKFKVSSALNGHDVAIRPRPTEDGVFDVFFAHHRCLTIDLNSTSPAC